MNIKYIITIVVTIIITALLTFLITRSTGTTDNNTIRNKANNVYDADYNRLINLESYNAIENYSIDDIILPYIDIDSDSVKAVNNEIKLIFDELLELYKQNLTKKNVWTTAKYFTYETNLKNSNDRFTSILIIKSSGGTTLPTTEYNAYTVNLGTKKALSMNEVINVFKSTLDSDVDMKEKIKTMLTDYQNSVLERETNLTIDEKNNLLNTALSSFEQLFETGKLPIFIDNAAQLNIIVKIYSANRIENITLLYK